MSIEAHLRSSGLDPRTVGQITKQINLWITSSGLEWACKRIKDLKAYYLKRLSGEHDMVSWISLDENGIPKGVFRRIFLLSGKNVKRALDCLMVYTTMTLQSSSRGQREKFFSSVTADPVNVPYIPYLRNAVNEFSHDLPFKRYIFSDYPFYGNRNVPTNKRSAKNEISLLGHERKYSIVRDLFHEFPSVFEDAFAELMVMHTSFSYEEEIAFPYIGKIACLQERGCKARFIANPILTVQFLSYSLAKYLESQLERVPTDCTYEQEKGVRWCESQLKQGRKVYSVDLSDFTNNFPRDLSLRVLSMLPNVPTDHSEFYTTLLDLGWDASRWLPKSKDSDYSNEYEPLYWTKGTPLGLRPSFPLFAYSHNVLLRSLEIKYGQSDTFRVLGDDVVISNPLIHWAYRRMLDRLGCPVSESKTLSGNIGEFASYIIMKHASFRPRKHPKDGFLQDAVRNCNARHLASCKNLRDMSQFVLYWMTKDNSSGLSLKTRAHLAFLMGLIKDPYEAEEPLPMPQTWNTLSLLVEILGVDLVFGELEPDQCKISQKSFNDFVETYPCIKELVSHLTHPVQESVSGYTKFQCKKLVNGVWKPVCDNYVKAHHGDYIAHAICDIKCHQTGLFYNLFKLPLKAVQSLSNPVKEYRVRTRDLLIRASKSLSLPDHNKALVSKFLDLN